MGIKKLLVSVALGGAMLVGGTTKAKTTEQESQSGEVKQAEVIPSASTNQQVEVTSAEIMPPAQIEATSTNQQVEATDVLTGRWMRRNQQRMQSAQRWRMIKEKMREQSR